MALFLPQAALSSGEKWPGRRVAGGRRQEGGRGGLVDCSPPGLVRFWFCFSGSFGLSPGLDWIPGGSGVWHSFG